MAHQKRPTHTPDGLPFPYSHYGDSRERTKLLQDIAKALNLAPGTVVNVGSGYDITPTDAFPEARVVHTDIAPTIVDFLIKAGFEAYEPQDMPDLEADIALSILGGNAHEIPLSKEGVVIATSNYVPEDMAISALVDNNNPHAIVTDLDDMQKLWYENGDSVHLVISRKLKEE